MHERPNQHTGRNTDEHSRFERPIMVVAFEGWNDAGNAASGAIEYLELVWDADPVLEIDDENYYDFQVSRPTVRLVDGITRDIEWPATTITWCRPPGADRDLLLVRGIEPNLRWRSFSAELLRFAESVGVELVVTLGALLADTAHTRPVPVSGTTFDEPTALRYGLTTSNYEGPTGIVGVIQDACVRTGLPAVSFWASLPHYVSAAPNPKATLALLARVEDVLELPVPLGTLPRQAAEWQSSIEQMTTDDDEIADYVRSLEERADDEAAETVRTQFAEIDGDTLAAQFEQYLRRHGR